MTRFHQRGIFPVFLIQPLLWLLLISGIVGSALWAKASYDDRRRDEGRAEVQTKWDADIALRIKRTSEITVQLSGDLMAAKDAAKKLEVQTNGEFSALEARIARLSADLSVVISAAAARVLDDATRAANRAGPPAAVGGGNATPDPVPVAAATTTYSEQELIAYIVKAGEAYADAVSLWSAARTREDLLRVTLAKLSTEVK